MSHPSTPFQRNITAALATIERLRELAGPVAAAADRLCHCLDAGGKILAAGNGGSAADAAHFTTELVCRLNHDRRPFPAICLNCHGGDLTAISNDYGYERAFERQVHAFARPDDLLLALSTSGNSPNIIRALNAAAQCRIPAIALLGNDGGAARGIAETDIIVPSPDTARIQEAHQLILHTLCQTVDQRLCGLD
jgi:D-sedoheptulose 7-phosphate isomerase